MPDNPLSLFIIEPDAPGITMHPIESVVMSPDKQFTMFFDNVKLGPEALVGVEGNGLKQVFVGLNTERVPMERTLGRIVREVEETPGVVCAGEHRQWL